MCVYVCLCVLTTKPPQEKCLVVSINIMSVVFLRCDVVQGFIKDFFSLRRDGGMVHWQFLFLLAKVLFPLGYNSMIG